MISSSSRVQEMQGRVSKTGGVFSWGQGEAIQRALLAGKGSHADQLLQVADEFLRC